uniref:protein disulfide-isomerase A3-like isoform X2 n=1 Tax=Myxine glutinosa TaxID=7769 RepID=UPI00358F7256
MSQECLRSFPADAEWGYDVIGLTYEEDLDARLAEWEHSMVDFYIEECGHCMRLAPEFDSAAEDLLGLVTLGKIDCSESKQKCRDHGVYGYPTIKMYHYGEAVATYEGPKKAGYVVRFGKRMIGPTSVQLNSLADFKNFTEDYDAGIVGFFPDGRTVMGYYLGWERSALAEWLRIAEVLRQQYRVAHTFAPDLLATQRGEEAVVLFRPQRLANIYEETAVRYPTKNYTLPKIRNFIKKNIKGLCPQLSQDNKEDLMKDDLLMVFYDVDWENKTKVTQYWRNRILKVMKIFWEKGDKLGCTIADYREFDLEMYMFHLRFKRGAPLVGIRTANKTRHTMTEKLTPEGFALENFVEEYFAKKKRASRIKLGIPVYKPKGVQEVVSKTFNEIVNDPRRDVLIQFCVPLHEECNRLEPKYRELAWKVSNDPNLLIARMDAITYKVPKLYEARSFPTIYLVPKRKKRSPKVYLGRLETRNMLEFLQNEVTRKPLIVRKKKKPKPQESNKKEVPTEGENGEPPSTVELQLKQLFRAHDNIVRQRKREEEEEKVHGKRDEL